MISFGTRKGIRTYSRQRKHSLHDEEPPTKRRRVQMPDDTSNDTCANKATTVPIATCSSITHESSAALLSSSKASADIFLDELPHSTPPSSPQLQSRSPPQPRRRPVFSVLKRKQKPQVSAKEALSERSNNVPSPPRVQKKKRLVQMQLDLVAEVSKTCKVCGMGYVPSHAEDAALHRKFHALNVGGVDVSKAACEKLRKSQVWSGGDMSFIAVVSRRDAPALRRIASEVLKVVNTELGAIPIPEELLWSQTRNSIAAHAQAQGRGDGMKAQQPDVGKDAQSSGDRFKAYLFVQGQKCVGACLAERIQDAFPVLDRGDAAVETGQHPADTDSSSITIGANSAPAILGISRIWTSNMHRKHGFASRLLDAARFNFLYGMIVDKADVAFSQPTESGGQLARKWFGKRGGWLVYID